MVQYYLKFAKKKPTWLRKGITTVRDVLVDNCKILSLEEFQNKYDISSNFLEYGGFAVTIKLFLDNREKHSFNVTRPVNCLLNNILLRGTKGVSNLYRALCQTYNSIINHVCLKWTEKGNIVLQPYEVRNSFKKNHSMVDDKYLRHTQFRTFHYRY